MSCHAIEADLFDYDTYDAGTQTGDWKGKQRILHAQASSSPFTYIISVSYFAWYFSYYQVGTLIDEDPAFCRITGPHAHQDFMIPTQSQNCATDQNFTMILTPDPQSLTNPDGKTDGLQRPNSDH